MKEFMLGVIGTLVFVLVFQWLRIRFWSKNKQEVSGAIRKKIRGDRDETIKAPLPTAISEFNRNIRRKS